MAFQISQSIIQNSTSISKHLKKSIILMNFVMLRFYGWRIMK